MSRHSLYLSRLGLAKQVGITDGFEPQSGYGNCLEVSLELLKTAFRSISAPPKLLSRRSSAVRLISRLYHSVKLRLHTRSEGIATSCKGHLHLQSTSESLSMC